MKLGSKFGYYTQPSKARPIVKVKHFETVRTMLNNTKVNM